MNQIPLNIGSGEKTNSPVGPNFTRRQLHRKKKKKKKNPPDIKKLIARLIRTHKICLCCM
jgi:hypothetical protein